MKRDGKCSVKWGEWVAMSTVSEFTCWVYTYILRLNTWRVGLGPETQLWSFPCCGIHWEQNMQAKLFTCPSKATLSGLLHRSLIFLWLLLHRALPFSNDTSNHHLYREAPSLINSFLLPFTIQTKIYTFLCIYSMFLKQSEDGTYSFCVHHGLTQTQSIASH